MLETVSNKLNPDVLPHLAIWRWEVPVYLFLGGLAAGLIIISAAMLIFKEDARNSTAVKLASLLSPVALGVGMGFLFLDLAYKLHVWTFYISFNPTAPMSWGSWILIVFFPLSLLQAGIVYKDELHLLPMVGGIAKGIVEKTEGLLKPIAVINAHIGIAVGAYTGILLSSLYARPLWSSSILGFLFLLSGLSAGAALMLIMAKKEEKGLFARIDMFLIALEAFAVLLFILGGLMASEQAKDAMIYLISGPYAAWFFALFILTGVIVPLLLETLEVLGKIKYSVLVPLLVLAGSLTLRFVIVYAGQAYQTFS